MKQRINKIITDPSTVLVMFYELKKLALLDATAQINSGGLRLTFPAECEAQINRFVELQSRMAKFYCELLPEGQMRSAKIELLEGVAKYLKQAFGFECQGWSLQSKQNNATTIELPVEYQQYLKSKEFKTTVGRMKAQKGLLVQIERRQKVLLARITQDNGASAQSVVEQFRKQLEQEFCRLTATSLQARLSGAQFLAAEIVKRTNPSRYTHITLSGLAKARSRSNAHFLKEPSPCTLRVKKLFKEEAAHLINVLGSLQQFVVKLAEGQSLELEDIAGVSESGEFVVASACQQDRYQFISEGLTSQQVCKHIRALGLSVVEVMRIQHKQIRLAYGEDWAGLEDSAICGSQEEEDHDQLNHVLSAFTL